jgi:hypothetical protein
VITMIGKKWKNDPKKWVSADADVQTDAIINNNGVGKLTPI